MFKLISLTALIAASTAAMAAAPAATTSPNAATDDSAQKYCLQSDPFTGSRIGRTECHTKAEWKRLDVDVDKMLAKNDHFRKR